MQVVCQSRLENLNVQGLRFDFRIGHLFFKNHYCFFCFLDPSKLRLGLPFLRTLESFLCYLVFRVNEIISDSYIGCDDFFSGKVLILFRLKFTYSQFDF